MPPLTEITFKNSTLSFTFAFVMGYLMKLITFLIVIGVIYNLLNRFIFPIFRISSSINNNMRKMQDQMAEMDKKMNQQQPKMKKTRKDGDYIDYEEVK